MKKKKQIDAIGKYFPLYLDSIRKIILQGGGVEEVLCFIVLCRGAGSSGETGWSCWSISTYIGISELRANRICAWLTTINLVTPIIPAIFYIDPTVKVSMRWKITGEGQPCFLPNSIVGAVKETIGPLGELYHSAGSYSSGISASQAKLLQLTLLLGLYNFHDLEEHGGVAPQIWTREWITPSTPGFKLDLPEGRFLATVEKGNPIYQPELVRWLSFGNVLPAENTEKHLKFALKNLVEKQMVFESVYVWEADPLQTNAEISYTLYHVQPWVRRERPLYLAEDITDFCTAALEGEDQKLFRHGEKFHQAYKGIFTMVGYGSNYHVRSALVLRHLPETKSHKAGRNTLIGRTLEFREKLKGMATRSQGLDEDSDWL